MPIDPNTWTRDEIERHSVDMRQFIDFRQSTLPNGMRIIEAYNSSGLTFTILPDRGLDIWTAHYNGIPLTWISQGSPHPPDFGQTWLQQFNGGLLTTCGLTHVGPPEKDDLTGEWRDIHGRYSRLRAGEVSVKRLGWSKFDKEYEIELSGTICESRLFGEQLRLERTYRLRLNSPFIYIMDKVTNVGDKPSPLMLLYHFNFGYPLISDKTRLYTPYEAVYPRDEAAKTSLSSWDQYDAASADYAEQVFFHHLKYKMYGDNLNEVLLSNDDFGISIGWNLINLRYMTQWKNTRQGIYVCGLEPGNCLPEGLNAARKKEHRLTILEPGEIQEFYCQVNVLGDAEAVKLCKRRIEKTRQKAYGSPIGLIDLDDYARFAQKE